MDTPEVVDAAQWQQAWERMLVKEKELTHARDALAAQRRRMPWQRIDKQYVFEGPDGRIGLPELFLGRRQLVVYRAFFEPGVYGWPEHPCPGCSMIADHVGNLAHLNARNTTLVFVSRAPQAEIDKAKQRMGWTMPWYTMITENGAEFDKDFGVDEWHGTNSFIHDGESVYRTYFVNNRGDEVLGNTFGYLDITALGRQETWEDSPDGYPQTPPYGWWKWHDEYPADGATVEPARGWKKMVAAGVAALGGTPAE